MEKWTGLKDDLNIVSIDKNSENFEYIIRTLSYSLILWSCFDKKKAA